MKRGIQNGTERVNVIRIDASACNNKQHWNEDKCRCECKELIDKGVCDKRFIWNPIKCECECDKSCDIGEYLDYENCKCRKKIVDKVAEESLKILKKQGQLKKLQLKIKININVVFAHCTVCYS